MYEKILLKTAVNLRGDYSGTDTISISDFSTDCIINLTPGTYSSLRYESNKSQVTYSGINNLGIAYECEIENAIGGSGDDRIIGNSLDNYLDGGFGNDTLYGHAGDDFFDWDGYFRGGDDVFYGGKGDDSYVFSSSADIAIELDNEGVDTIWVSFNYDMGSTENIEWLIGFGSKGLTLAASHQNNNIRGTDSNDVVYGKSGIDHYYIKDLDQTDCSIKVIDSSVIIIDTPSLGLDELHSIERVLFKDVSIAFDIEGATSAGGIYRLYKATFNREPDKAGLGYWIDQADLGIKDAVRMAEDFTWSDEFQALYNITTTDNYGAGTEVSSLVSGFYQNVLGRDPDKGGLNYYTGVIESREKTVGRVLAEISDSPENYNMTFTSIQSGIEYDYWIG